ncbi:tyrosine--tRNA ligase [Marivirga sp. S37H4]|uniref:Tyrosine--tRNA ligase n=1 Tax=Marivirga aurantiaca TaxID=2802615 RepID=A0A935C9Y2_9BACT|nr:tyrosine--tRNA ligase [Marivirga aurantiaca]MBK6266275.1 tyrosine--tRNA ligase [Marivirga aurantiaca]
MQKDFIEELTWRGMIHDQMPGIQDQLKKELTAAYVGIDPTADSLHIGHLVGVMMLKHFQDAGHRPIVLLGGATGMIGDPSGKSQERNLLDEPTLRHNEESIKKQVMNFLDFDSKAENGAVLVNNYDWMKDFSFLGFIRDVGKHLTVNYMMAKDSVKKRLSAESSEGMSFTEFTYQLVQGYDFLHLYKAMNCKLQMGGSDQWGNITTGTELIRKMIQGEAYAVTTPLIKKADGTKFGKTESGNIWLDPKKTSPYKFYQFWLNASDEDMSNFIRIFSTKGKEEIEALEKEHQQAPHLRTLQKALAEEITVRVHSQEALDMALKASSILFGKSTTEELASIDEDTLLSVFEGVPQVEITKEELASVANVTDFLSETTKGIVFPSKGEARKMIQGGGVSINKEKVIDANAAVSYQLLQNKYLLVQRGKKNYYLVIVN